MKAHLVRGRDLVHRWEGNPCLTIDDLPFACADICNAGAVKVGREYVLLPTIQNLQGSYSIYIARSMDGYHFQTSEKPIFSPGNGDPESVHDQLGVLDARISKIGNEYYISFDALGLHGYRLALARTTDFVSFERIGYMSEPDMKSGVLFPEKIKGQFARLERPWDGGSIWISFSEDLKYWGNSQIVMTPRGGYWDCDRIGVAAPPIRLPQYWLVIYYGVKQTSAGPLFRLGAALLDRRNPARVIGRTGEPILSPRERYERIGDLPNLVFSCGAVLEDDGLLRLYYGASNSCIAVGFAETSRIIESCLSEEQ